MAEGTDEKSPARYSLNPGQSRFTVQAFATGFLSGLGHDPVIGIQDFSGAVEFDPANPADASLRLEVRAGSLALLDEVKDKDRREIEQTMFEEVLEIDRYPEIVFQSTKVTITRITEDRYKARIIGDLTLHGETRNGLWISAQFTLDGDNLRAQGDFTLRQTDYGIKLVSVAAGALKLKDELKFNFDLVGRRAGR